MADLKHPISWPSSSLLLFPEQHLFIFFFLLLHTYFFIVVASLEAIAPEPRGEEGAAAGAMEEWTARTGQQRMRLSGGVEDVVGKIEGQPAEAD